MILNSQTQPSKPMSSLIITRILNITYSLASNASWSSGASTMTTEGVNIAPEESLSTLTVTSQSRPLSHADSRMTVIGANAGSDTSDADALKMFNTEFAKVVDPVAIAIGIVGNALLALVFLITPLRLRPLSHVLAALGVVDLLYTLSCLLVYLTTQGVQVYKVPMLCQITTFILTFAKSVEAWYIFVSHLNRLRAHTSSGREGRKRRVFNTKFAILIIALLVAAPLLHMLWSTETLEYASVTYCVPMRETMMVHLTLRKLEMVATVYVPLLLIAGVDLMLILKFAMVMLLKDDDDDDDDDNDCKKIDKSYGSSFCTDKIINMPIQAKNTDNSGACQKLSRVRMSLGSTSSVSQGDCYQMAVISVQCHEKPSLEVTPATLEDQSLGKVSEEGEIISDSSASSPLTPTVDLTLTECYSQSLPHASFTTDECKPATVSEVCKSDSLQASQSEFPCNDNAAMRERETAAATDRKNSESNQPLSSCLNTASSNDCKNSFSQGKTCRAVDFVLSSFHISQCRKRQDMQVSFREDNYVPKQHPTKKKNRKARDENCSENNISYSFLRWRSYDHTTYVSSTCATVSRSQAIPEDHEIPSDVTACTVTTMLMGIVFAITILPATYMQTVNLFFDSSTSRPTPYAMQQAILFESLVKLNAVYKFLIFVLAMPSFRYAIMWLLTHWIPSKITRKPSICMWGPDPEKNETVPV